ncbi:MAG TPA: hypothetical protein VEZ88_13315 [Steroidobacteraceae bacterium]|nr:hypothetical protein [Steroidobacteraceae bacterium]
MQQRRRTCPVSGLPLEDVASSLKTADGRALDLDKVEQKVPEFRELRRIADTIDGRVLVGFGRHPLSISRAMEIDQRAGEVRALPRADDFRVHSAYHLVQVPVGETGRGEFCSLRHAAEFCLGREQQLARVRTDEKNTSGLKRGK